MATKPVKHFHSGMAGAPTLTGAAAAGKLQLLLQACLVDGFNSITLDSLVVSANVLTGTKAGHGFVVDQVIATSANEASLISEWTVTSVTASTFTADATGVSNVTGTGTLTAKAASLGWTNAFATVGNVAAFKSSDAASSGCVLRIDDSGSQQARVVGYETMTDLNTGSGPFPTTAQMSGGGYFAKSSAADTSTRAWALFGDGRLFYLFTNNPTTVQFTMQAFGDFVSEKAADAYCCMLACQTAAATTSAGNCSLLAFNYTFIGSSGIYIPRSYTALGSSITAFTGFASLGASGTSACMFPYPSPASNGLVLTPVSMRESAVTVLRALALPGLYATPLITPLTHLDKVTNVTGLSGRTIMAVNTWPTSAEGRAFFDLTGPWR